MRVVVLLAAFLTGLTLAACSGSGADEADYGYASDAGVAADAVADSVDAADVDALDVEVPDFDNCIDDCSGHEAGFQWAQDQDVTDSSECGGKSNSFIEGCEAFAQQREAAAEEQAHDAEDDVDYE